MSRWGRRVSLRDDAYRLRVNFDCKSARKTFCSLLVRKLCSMAPARGLAVLAKIETARTLRFASDYKLVCFSIAFPQIHRDFAPCLLYVAFPEAPRRCETARKD